MVNSLKTHLADLLLSICRIDTTPRADLAAFATAEESVFALIEKEVRSWEIPGMRIVRVPIRADIQPHPFYSKPYYAITPDHPAEKSAAETYAGRHNLVVMIDPSSPNSGQNEARPANPPGLALNAHIDVVKPYIAPRIEGDTLFGRGACDDKGPVVSILGALRMLAPQIREKGLTRPLTLMFVIEEEMGGNGSLSLALDRDLRRRYGALAVLECCSSNIYPGNRGAVWYKIEARVPGVNLFETAAYIVEEMEREGRAIKAESRHDLFPHRPVQTCHGILGGFGEHPSRICGRIDFNIRIEAAGQRPADTPSKDTTKPSDGSLNAALPLMQDIVDSAISQYTALYGDKTKVIDPSTNRPKVDHHFDIELGSDVVTLRIHGSTGHMGSILQNDGAITKMAFILRALIDSRPALERAAGGAIVFNLVNWPDASHLLMEGGQGFLPTHPMPEVMSRLRAAVWRGARRHFDSIGRRDLEAEKAFTVTFDKLHNAAFAGDPNSPLMRSAVAAAKSAGIWKDQPIRGWDVSCDARIFAIEHPDLQVITTGPGHLIHAHADNEQIDLNELAQFTQFLASFISSQVIL